MDGAVEAAVISGLAVAAATVLTIVNSQLTTRFAARQQRERDELTTCLERQAFQRATLVELQETLSRINKRRYARYLASKRSLSGGQLGDFEERNLKELLDNWGPPLPISTRVLVDRLVMEDAQRDALKLKEGATLSSATTMAELDAAYDKSNEEIRVALAAVGALMRGYLEPLEPQAQPGLRRRAKQLGGR